jgi:hypothetical protein
MLGDLLEIAGVGHHYRVALQRFNKVHGSSS